MTAASCILIVLFGPAYPYTLSKTFPQAWRLRSVSHKSFSEDHWWRLYMNNSFWENTPDTHMHKDGHIHANKYTFFKVEFGNVEHSNHLGERHGWSREFMHIQQTCANMSSTLHSSMSVESTADHRLVHKFFHMSQNILTIARIISAGLHHRQSQHCNASLQGQPLPSHTHLMLCFSQRTVETNPLLH